MLVRSAARRWLGACLAVMFTVAVGPTAVAAPAGRQEGGPFQAWQQRLAGVEAGLRKAAPADEAARARLHDARVELRVEVEAWIAAHPQYAQQAGPQLESPASGATLVDLAAETGRLRAVVTRVRAAAEGGDSGAFYLGRVDVAVTAAAPAAATAEMAPAGASVLDSADLRAHDRPALAGALALAPGVTFTRVGSRNESAVYVRGFDMRQVPLFIDGIPIYTPYDGYVDLERFTTFDLAEVRVSKGFASVLYGANTLGGAINVVSRRPADRLEGTGGVGYGSGSSRNAYLNAGSRLGRWYIQGNVSYLEADTYPLAGGFSAVKTQPAGDRLNAYRRDGKASVKVGWTPNGTDEYAVSYVGQRGRKGNPPYAGADTLVKTRYWKWPYWDKDSVYLISNTHVGAGYLRGRAYYDTYDNALYSYDDGTYTTQVKSSAFQSLYRDHTLGASLEWGTGIGSRQSLRVAAHYKRDAHEDHNVGEPLKQFEGRIASVGVEDTITLSPRLSLVAGLGADWQATTRALDYQKAQVLDLLATCAASGTSCGDAHGVNPQAGLFYAVPSGLVRLTVSRKTRMPSMKDRYSYKFGTAVPNPDLAAEHNLTTEAGYQGALGAKSSFQAAVFYSRIDDLIQRFVLSANLSQLRNIGRASHKGVELDVRTRAIPMVELSATYSFLARRNISDPSVPLVDAPRHKATLSAIVAPLASLRVVVGIDGEAGRRTMNEAGTYYNVPSFSTTSLKAAWTVHRALDLEIGVLNLFDRSYWMMDGYPEAGRTVLATARCRF
jgi:iron complex outermembrane recepter protein